MNHCRSLCLTVPLLEWRLRKCVKCFTPCMEMPFRPMTACAEQGAKHSWDPKWTAFVHHSQRYLPSCTALNCDSKVRYYSYRWHEVSTLVCVPQQLLIWLLTVWLGLSVCTCMPVWLYACMAVWACAVSVNYSMCPLDLKVELCALAPVRQNTGHALPLHACHSERTLGSSFMCHVYSRVRAS